MTDEERITAIRNTVNTGHPLSGMAGAFLLAELDRAREALQHIAARVQACNVNTYWDEIYDIARAALGESTEPTTKKETSK